MMKYEKFIALLSKKLSGELHEEESALLEKAAKENETYRLLEATLHSYFMTKSTSDPASAQISDVWELLEKHQDANEEFNYAQPKKAFYKNNNFLKIAAMLVVLVGGGLMSYFIFSNHAELEFITLKTTNHKTFRLLDDGTKVWVNKNSTISFNKAFGNEKREITLEGEAYFDVVKNKNVPLHIQAGSIAIEVKGTAFNVKAYKESPEIRVALVRGLIQITNRSDIAHKVLLHPNEQLILNNSKNKDTNDFLIRLVEPSVLLNATNWKADTLVFNKEKLVDLVVRMERKYDIKIDIKSENLKEKRFSGTFINETIQQALEALKLSFPLTYTINNKLVVIKD